MNTRTANEGGWLFKDGVFARQIISAGDISSWEEVTEEFKQQYEHEHAEPMEAVEE